MTLTGVDPFDPTPMHRFEVVLGAGPGPGSQPEYKVLIFGNKTSAGSETVDTLGGAVLSDDDCIARFGRRSELRRMYRDYIEVDPKATIHMIAVTESVTTAGACDLTFTGTSTAQGIARFTIQGETIDVPFDTNATPTAIAAASKAAINACDGGSLMFTSDNSSGVLTITSVHKGPRFSLHVGADISHGIRCQIVGTGTGVTVAKGNVVAGAGEDDATAAFAAAIPGVDAYQWVVPWGHLTSAPTATDNQLGEAFTNIASQASPSNGNRWTIHFGFVGTQAQQTTVCTASPVNMARGTCWWAESNDWLPGRLAAHGAAATRVCYVGHPSGGKLSMIGFTNDPDRGTVWLVPPPFLSTDRPLASEIKAALNNGGTPIAFQSTGRSYIVRHITTRSLNAQGSNDYKAREGHITWAIDHFVNTLRLTYQAELQPFIAEDPAKGAKPSPRTSTPSSIASLIRRLIDDYCGPKPLSATYTAPILAPDKAEIMKSKVAVTKTTGGFTVALELYAVEHLIKSETYVAEVGFAY